jgi:cell fate (sporulation/competence/biofilm development) regulator YmcA (YheA/YmcA/DUF963 family)
MVDEEKFESTLEDDPDRQEGSREVTLWDVDRLFERTGSPHISKEERQDNLDAIEDEEERRELQEIADNRSQELTSLRPPAQSRTVEVLLDPIVSRDEVESAAAELPKAEEMLSNLKKWKREWEDLSEDDQVERSGRIKDLQKGSGIQMVRKRDWEEAQAKEKEMDHLTPEIRRKLLIQDGSTMSVGVEDRIVELEDVVTKVKPRIQEYWQKSDKQVLDEARGHLAGETAAAEKLPDDVKDKKKRIDVFE